MVCIYTWIINKKRSHCPFWISSKKSHVAIWNWIQKYWPKDIITKKKNWWVYNDEAIIKVGSQHTWFCLAIDPKNEQYSCTKPFARNSMYVAKRFLSYVVRLWKASSFNRDGDTWYPQACKFMKLKHLTHSLYEKSIVESAIQYVPDLLNVSTIIFFVTGNNTVISFMSKTGFDCCKYA